MILTRDKFPQYTNSSNSSISKNKQSNQKWAGALNRHFSKKICIYIHIDGQQTYEKMFNIANYYRNADQNYNEVSLYTSQSGHHEKLQIINVGESVEKKEHPYPLGGNCATMEI